MKNMSGIRPVEFKVVILPKEVTEKVGSIYLPDTVKDKDQFAQMEGTLIASSPLAFTYADWPSDKERPKPGDRVMYARYSGAVWKGKDGKDYRIVNDKDITAVLE